MGKIKQLDQQLTNMIAAGEVVERPAGIVKELVENALDANSKNITVNVTDGGINCITVMDDGEGMDASDALMAFERHATSKIHRPNDLWAIHSFGFRGEALPSIASVSTIALKTNNGHEGTLVQIENGKVVQNSPVATNEGTCISVEKLFYKVPARLKHLKHPAYEYAIVYDTMVKFALSHPEVSFKLISDNRQTLLTPGNNNLLAVIYEIFGKEKAKSAIPVDIKDTDFHVTGYLFHPQYTKTNRNHVHVFMNGRMVKPYRIIKAVSDCYADYIPNDRYPIAVLNIEMDPQLVDVNVHPSKWEIRLSKQAELELLLKEQLPLLLKQSMRPFVIEAARVKEEPIFQQEIIERVETSVMQSETVEEATLPFVEKFEPLNVQRKIEVFEPEVASKSFPAMSLIGQFHHKFILAQGDNGLYVIDQHAAQERVHFEEIMEKIKDNHETQELLYPVMIQVGYEIVQLLDELNTFVKSYDIQFELFGDDTLVVHVLPVWLKDIDHTSFLNDLIEYFKNNRKVDKETTLRHKIATMACKRSIRFNRALTKEEMQAVISQLANCEQPFQCPHGRPTFILIEDSSLEREFLR